MKFVFLKDIKITILIKKIKTYNTPDLSPTVHVGVMLLTIISNTADSGYYSAISLLEAEL